MSTSSRRHRLGPCPRRRAGGTVLIVTMWVVLVLAGLVLVFARSMRVEAAAAANLVASLQADAVLRGAVQYVLSQVQGLDGAVPSATDTTVEAVQVGDGFFWILSPDTQDDQTPSFGIVDEASRIGLNSAPAEILQALPNMTQELAAAIIDWRDSDSNITPGGAENEYYLLLEQPYYCKNAPFETVEELLYVAGATRQLLYGEDANRNGVLDPNENDGDATEPDDNRDGVLDRGLLSCLTVHGSEPNTSASGETRINVNDSETGSLSELLRTFMSDDRRLQIIARVRSTRPFTSVLDFYVRTDLESSEFSQIADQLTISTAQQVTGRVNVNTAPRRVLLCLPGLGEGDVDTLISYRSGTNVDLSSIAWVAEALPKEKLTAIGPYITARTYQFSADIVAVSGDGRAFRRRLVVIDAQSTPAHIVYSRDLTDLGWPLDRDILQKLRSGASLPAAPVSVAAGVR